ncbi:SDR family NAD(P)-dependent oxidoreductase [Homoserinibacter sp. GY 40078]|uniref:SDR family NAD(P)-dependent oxidoreductase n=1 Tax=Homoserinibacter sp. GY 40078 TaxID=2603275 RepID=UPI0011CA3B09|nr:SDR family NAD(P)-dependent oxidoreductase [Homoserinibacter sp. GY 40078]TXK19897.1 SDR family NAD(P)-dependent oxidoreductase [Homoserinibacter sp. GY 40078]
MASSSEPAPVALVTGASQGIGLETARRLVEAGCTVYVGARNPERGTAAAQEIGTRFVPLEVTSDESVEAAAAHVEAEAGHLDILINNAGITGPQGDVHDLTAAGIEQVLATNVVGYVRVIHGFLPLLERAEEPRIVNVTSGLGSLARFHDRSTIESRVGNPFYAASKAAINMLTVRYARLLPRVRINAADPGLTATKFTGGMGHSVTDGTDAIIRFAIGEDRDLTGRYRDRDGDVPW